MSYRFTNTDKWVDSWFSNLSQIQMLLFMYLCDNCDIAGFIEVNYKRWANDLGSSSETIEGACKGLARGFVLSKNSDCLYLKNFLKHQKNLPINENNKAHVGILRRFELYKHKFDIENVNDFIEGGSKGLPSPTGIGIGIGTGIGTGDKSLREGGEIPKPDDEIISVEIVTILTFDEFWDMYDKKVGLKEKVRKKFEATTEKDREKIITHIIGYKLAQPDKQYRKDPATYLNNKSWNDEIILKNGNQQRNSKGGATNEDLRDLFAERYGNKPE